MASRIGSLEDDLSQLQAVVLGFPPEYEGGLRKDLRHVQQSMTQMIEDGHKRDARLKFIWGVAMFAAGKMSLDWIIAGLKWAAKVAAASP